VARDPHVLGPGLEPTPFTAAEIRDGCPPGRTIRLLVEDDGAPPYVRYNRFVDCDETGALVERGRDGEPGERSRTTWAGLQAHAAFPVGATTVEPDTIDIPLGVLDCTRYTVRDEDDEDGVTVFWFAPAYPGMPVRFTRVENGRPVATTTMIESSG
jgi:hypothetical protein